MRFRVGGLGSGVQGSGFGVGGLWFSVCGSPLQVSAFQTSIKKGLTLPLLVFLQLMNMRAARCDERLHASREDGPHETVKAKS